MASLFEDSRKNRKFHSAPEYHGKTKKNTGKEIMIRNGIVSIMVRYGTMLKRENTGG
ncbi:MAG TPA: hypothetical protein PKD52_02480 [Clostridiales bacterium]|nr:hypothetical protein [Clostridiales bacterium]